jgi:hypothetical protein
MLIPPVKDRLDAASGHWTQTMTLSILFIWPAFNIPRSRGGSFTVISGFLREYVKNPQMRQALRIWAHPAASRRDRAIRLNKFLPGGIPPGKNLYRFYPLRVSGEAGGGFFRQLRTGKITVPRISFSLPLQAVLAAGRRN